MSQFHCSILLLAGGRGQRMGGQDKGLLRWQGQPLISHAQRVARPLTDDLIISCNRNHAHYAAYADQVVNDGNDDFDGPLAGILAGLAVARHSHLLVLPCDVPRIDTDLIRALFDTARLNLEQPVMVRHGEHWEPLLCVIPVALKGAFDTAWQNGQRSPRNIMLELNAQACVCAQNDPRLLNVNTPDLLELSQ